MWHDVETSTDLLNFSVVADTAAQLIRDSDGQPISIGISGSWGVGKSSLVKMIGYSLKNSDTDKKYIFLEFNAWLYQGFDDARIALLQSVADKLVQEAKKREKFEDKALDFAKRVDWLRIGKLLAPVAQGAVFGGAIGGPVGALVGAVGGLFASGGTPSGEDLNKAKEAYEVIHPELRLLLKEKKDSSPPKEIEALRASFAEVLEEMDVSLVVLVDDLDRCLPNTAIATLEAMRLLLFMPRTAFIIAADEEMIRGAVQAHFRDIDLSTNLVTSYFDKLIQIPLRVPRLGVTEVKAYLTLLFADLEVRRGNMTKSVRDSAQQIVLADVKKSWAGTLSRKSLEAAFKGAPDFVQKIDVADQIAPLLTTASHTAGNPRLIKRFMNNLVIREAIANAQGMSIAFEALVKLQLFERGASATAFEFLLNAVSSSPDGKAPFLKELEEAAAKGEDFKNPDQSWDTPFVSDWLKLSPPLADVDLRPLLYLSRDKGSSYATFDELSADGRKLMEALKQTTSFTNLLVQPLKDLGEAEAERVLTRMMRHARSEQWTSSSLIACLHVIRAFPNLSSVYAPLLNEIPVSKRPAALIPHLDSESWSVEILASWGADTNTPQPVKAAIKSKVRKK